MWGSVESGRGGGALLRGIVATGARMRELRVALMVVVSAARRSTGWCCSSRQRAKDTVAGGGTVASLAMVEAGVVAWAWP